MLRLFNASYNLTLFYWEKKYWSESQTLEIHHYTNFQLELEAPIIFFDTSKVKSYILESSKCHWSWLLQVPTKIAYFSVLHTFKNSNKCILADFLSSSGSDSSFTLSSMTINYFQSSITSLAPNYRLV